MSTSQIDMQTKKYWKYKTNKQKKQFNIVLDNHPEKFSRPPSHWGLYTLYRSSHRRCSTSKNVNKNPIKFTGLDLCRNLFFNKVAGLSEETFVHNQQTTLNWTFFLKWLPVCFNLFVFLFLVTPYLAVAVQPCMEWIPIWKRVFSYEFCKISKNTSFTEHYWATASRATRISFDLTFTKFDIANC